jgi:prevent-host-death family protein
MIRPMEKVPVHELKENLSAYLARAEAGESLVVTRHGRPVVRISAIATPHVQVGSRVGQLVLKPVIRGGLGGRALEILREDREDRLDELFP